MTSGNFKQDVLIIEQELRDIKGNSQRAFMIRRDILAELYCLLHSIQSVRYFIAIFRKTGAQSVGVAKGMCNVRHI